MSKSMDFSKYSRKRVKAVKRAFRIYKKIGKLFDSDVEITGAMAGDFIDSLHEIKMHLLNTIEKYEKE